MDMAAGSVDATRALLPHFGELFRGMDALGCSPREAAGLLERAGVGPRDRVLDGGCGRGGASVEVASRLGARITGIDAVEVFLDRGRELARERGVSHLCTFRRGDLRRLRGRFDAAMFLGVAPLDEVIRWGERTVRRGGVIVIDDAVAIGADPRAPTREEARVMLGTLGRIEREVLFTPSRVERMNASLLRRLEANARRLAAAKPRLRPSLRAFIARQRAANRVLVGPIRPVVWVVRRRG